MITLVRHSQSTHNLYGDKTRDCPLTEHGIKQASTIIGTYDLVICSTLKRARQTLAASQLIYKEVIFTDLCREIRDRNPINLLPEEEASKIDNETRLQITARIEEFRKFLKECSNKFEKIAVISHGVFLGHLSGHPSHNCEQWLYKIT